LAASITSRALDLAQLPARHGETSRGDNSGVIDEAFSRLLVALLFANVERPLAMSSRLDEVARKITH
jgi:hypothetical protein